MRRHDVGLVVGRYTGPTDDKRHVDVLLVAAYLPRLHSVLANVVGVVAGIDEIRILEDAIVLKTSDESVDQFVDCLQRAQTLTVEVVVVVYIGLVLPREV